MLGLLECAANKLAHFFETSGDKSINKTARATKLFIMGFNELATNSLPPAG